jgi:hypothetical protein
LFGALIPNQNIHQRSDRRHILCFCGRCGFDRTTITNLIHFAKELMKKKCAVMAWYVLRSSTLALGNIAIPDLKPHEFDPVCTIYELLSSYIPFNNIILVVDSCLLISINHFHGVGGMLGTWFFSTKMGTKMCWNVGWREINLQYLPTCNKFGVLTGQLRHWGLSSTFVYSRAV